MKRERFLSMILVTMLCLSVVGQQAQAQQPGSLQSKADSSGYVLSNSSTLLARVWRGGRSGFSRMPSSRASVTGLSSAMAASPPAVLGAGAVGKISMWVGTGPSGNSILGDSIITQLNGNIGIGLATPTSKLAVQGMIETTLGGYKFPDGTVQTTAAVTGLQSVAHDSTLTGNGMSGSPLGVAVPLSLVGAAPDSILLIRNTQDGGSGMFATGGNTINGFGGLGVFARGGFGGSGGGGIGVFGFGGSSESGEGGYGVRGFGGDTTSGSFGGNGVVANGGVSQSGDGGRGVWAFGGISSSGGGGRGLEASGGFGYTGGGEGVLATGGFSQFGLPGRGVEARGGDSEISRGGTGVQAVGGSSSLGQGGRGVVATGGNHDSTSTGGKGGIGVEARGGSGNGDVGGSGVEAAGGAPLGKGVVATGGFGGTGLEAIGGGGSNTTAAGAGVNATGGTNTFGVGGTGVFATGGLSSDSADAGGVGLVAIGGAGNPSGRAALFGGRVEIDGDLTVTGTKNFKIDHPLDPENKYLLHASIESSEVLNIYSGNIVTDANGEVVVTLPEWFEILNRDLRYQLTVIGIFAQAIVAEKVKHNRFTIRTNAPNVEVSWQVIGVRSDAVMLKHPFKAEEDKPERERGTYLNPEVYGQPEERGAAWVRYSEMMQQLKKQRLKAELTQRQ